MTDEITKLQTERDSMRILSLLKPVQNGASPVLIWLGLLVAAAGSPDSVNGQSVDLGTAGDFAVLAGAGITNTGSTTIFGNVGTFPTPSITGFNTVTLDGVLHGDNAVSQQAKFDLLTAYNDAAGRPASPENTFAPIFNLGGLSLIPGVYNNPTSFEITGVLTLDGQGSSDSVWIFQTGSSLLTASNSTVSLINGADACNIFWQVGSSATLGTGTDFAGTIIALTSITLNTGATVDGRALAVNGAVTMDGNTILRSVCELVVDGTTTITVPISIDTVSLGDGSALLLSTTLTVTDGDFHVATGEAIISGGNVIVTGDLTKTGDGTLDASTSMKIGGSANINDGTLLVNATLEADQAQVSPDGTLGGSGIIIGDVVNSGLVAPGSPPGSLTASGKEIGTLEILGDYTQTSGGALQIEIAGGNDFDSLVVSGTTRLDGTLNISTIDGHDLEYGDQYLFLEAGNIVGAFDEILMPGKDLRGRFLSTGQTGTLLVAPTSYTLVAETPNQIRVARALDEWIGIERGDIGTATLTLDLLKAEDYPVAFVAIMPGFFGGTLITGIELSHNQGQHLFQQLSSRRLGRPRVPSTEYAEPLTHDGSGKGVLSHSHSGYGARSGGKNSKEAPQPPFGGYDENSQWNTWVQGSGLFSEGGLSSLPGEDFSSGAITVGVDRAVTENLALGLFASRQEGWGDYNNGGKMNLESVRGGGYAALDFEGFYASGATGVGTTDYHMRRPIQWATLDRTARSDTEGSEYFAMLGTGYDFHAGNFSFGPTVSAQYTSLSIEGFTERGADALDLRLSDFEAESLRTNLGGRIAYLHRVSPKLTVIPEARAFWQHDHLDQNTNLYAELNGGSGPGFNYMARGDGGDSVIAGAGVEILLGNGLTVSTFYHANMGHNDGMQHSVSVTLSLEF